MIARSMIALTIAAALVTLPQAPAAAKGPDAKAFAGTWKLDLAKSKFSAARYTPKRDTRTYAVAGDRVTMRSDMVDGAGRPMKWSYSARTNGKLYPISGNRNADHVKLSLTGARAIHSESMSKGKLASKADLSVSEDGTELTINRSLMTPDGPTDDVAVYNRK